MRSLLLGTVLLVGISCKQRLPAALEVRDYDTDVLSGRNETVEQVRGISKLLRGEPDANTRLHYYRQGGTLLSSDLITRLTKEHAEVVATINDRNDRLIVKANAIARVLVDAFINDANYSTLTLIGRERAALFMAFPWQRNDYPGNGGSHSKKLRGRNVDQADIRFEADKIGTLLTRIRPQRRVNTTIDALVNVYAVNTQRWLQSAAAMEKKWRSFKDFVPSGDGVSTHLKLCQLAIPSVIEMALSARQLGLNIVPLSTHRSAARARKNAAKRKNGAAVASRSPHTFGLAIDFMLSVRDRIRVAEITTRPFTNVLKMRFSPIHKWLFMYGETYGWYPYAPEPWHFEYNPPGKFRKHFCKGVPFCNGTP